MKPLKVTERELSPLSGYLALLTAVILVVLSIAGVVLTAMLSSRTGITILGLSIGAFSSIMFTLIFAIWIAVTFLFCSLKIIQPVEARVFTLFGKYYGTIKKAGFYSINPFCISFSPDYEIAKDRIKAKQQDFVGTAVSSKKTISLKTQSLDNNRQKVNDVLGNPIIIGAIVIWRVEDPTQAVFSVENYREFLGVQTDSTIRNIARLYPYDVFDEDEGDDIKREKTLRGSSLEIAETMKIDLQERVLAAGLYIDEVRITHLAYAEEIAAAMLQRQQAVAIIAARQKIIEGAVGMVKNAIEKLGEDSVVLLDEERKASMVSNLLVVLCGNHDAQPIINTGSLY